MQFDPAQWENWTAKVLSVYLPPFKIMFTTHIGLARKPSIRVLPGLPAQFALASTPLVVQVKKHVVNDGGQPQLVLQGDFANY